MKNRKWQKVIFLGVALLYSVRILFGSEGLTANGSKMLGQLLKAMVGPDIQVIGHGLIALFESLAYAVLGLFVALVFGLFYALILGNVISLPSYIKKLVYGLMVFCRGTHELVFALFFVAAIGLNPVSGVLAIGIHYGAMMGRVFSEMFLAVKPGPVRAVAGTGAGNFQVFLYAYLPLCLKDMIAYSLYRLECALRSSLILGFVGVGGIGLKIQFAMRDLNFNEMFTYIYLMIGFAIVLEVFSRKVRLERLSSKVSIIIGTLALVVSLVYLYSHGLSFMKIFSKASIKYGSRFLGGLLGIGNPSPAFFQIEKWKLALNLVFESLEMGLLAIVLSSLFMVLTLMVASHNYGIKGLRGVVRLSYLLSRTIPEPLWAMILIFILKPGVVVGALALAIHNYGVLGKICQEMIDELPRGPLNGIRSCGAGKGQLLLYGVWPLAMRRLVGYIMYRLDIIMRATIVVGMVGAGGLGYHFKTSMSWLHYSDITMVLMVYLGLVTLTDRLSHWVTVVVDDKV